MFRNGVVRIVALIVIVASLVLLAASAQAGEEQSLGDLLVEKGYITPDELEAVEQETAAEPEQPAVSAAPEPEEEPGIEFRVNHKGIAIESADGAFQFAFGGRLQLDAAVFIKDRSPLGDGVEVRRARIKSYGHVWSDWKYKLEVNFDANSEVSITDGWVQYAGFDPFTITVGHQKVPFSQQSMSSSNWQVFQERGLPDAFIDNDEEGRRRLGVVLGSYGDHWNAYGGFFGQGVESSGTSNSDWGTAGRAVWAPWAEKTKVLTFGGSVYYRSFDSTSDLRYASRPESNLAGTKMVDTGELPDAEETLEWNLETSFVCGRFHGQAEYFGVEVYQDGGMRDLSFSGWYAQAGVFLTGESRNYDVKSGQYKSITPLNRYGAWELAARFSRIDLQSNGLKGGRENNMTLGVNWWVNTNVMFRFNYVYADLSPNSGVALAGRDEQAHAFTARAQLVF